MAYYRLYRPQKISELDKEEVRQRLLGMLSHGSISHALLFAGPKGTGKTSTARIIAKVLNCSKQIRKPKSSLAEPCGICENCQAVMNGSHIDVYEIDAASNRGIDEIRELRDKINLAPAMGGAKVYIIDEVHMLTREAFNALLKTLEEPPAHAYFILATTEEHKLPDTILSRCTKIQFAKATVSELTSSLARVVAGEHIPIKEDALGLIASYAGGSFRDATKLLEQAHAESALSYERVQKMIGASASVEKLLTLLSEKKTKECLTVIQTEVSAGVDFLNLVGTLLSMLHGSLLAVSGVVSDDTKEHIVSLSKNEIVLLIKLLSRAYVETKTSFIESLPLELAVVEYCNTK